MAIGPSKEVKERLENSLETAEKEVIENGWESIDVGSRPNTDNVYLSITDESKKILETWAKGRGYKYILNNYYDRDSHVSTYPIKEKYKAYKKRHRKENWRKKGKSVWSGIKRFFSALVNLLIKLLDFLCSANLQGLINLIIIITLLLGK